MSLPSLNWRKLPTRTFLQTDDKSVDSLLGTVYDMLTGSLYFDGSARVPGSASAWTAIGKFVTGSGTGSNIEAVFCRPPTLTELSQSVIFSGVQTAGARTNPASIFLTNNQSVVSSNTPIYVACIKNASGPVTASNWFASNGMFGSGSVSTGYATMFTGSAHVIYNLRIAIYESQEAIGLFFSTITSNGNFNNGGFAGALIDPEQTITSGDAESDNRIYAIATSNHGQGIREYFWSQWDGTNVISGNKVLGNNWSFLQQHTTSGDSKLVMLNPQTGSIRSLCTLKGTSYPDTTFSTISGKIPKVMVLVMAGSTDGSSMGFGNGPFVGRLRDITMTRDFVNNSVIRDQSNNTLGFTISRSDTYTGNTVFLSY